MTGVEAQELERQTERALGLAIRAGQERGEIRKLGDDCRTDLHRDEMQVSARDAIGVSSWSQVVPMHDLAAAEPEQFDAALTEAKAEGNLNDVAYVNAAGYIRLRRATPTECRRCHAAVLGVRPNWGAHFLCSACLIATHEKVAHEARQDAYEALQGRIERYEAGLPDDAADETAGLDAEELRRLHRADLTATVREIEAMLADLLGRDVEVAA